MMYIDYAWEVINNESHKMLYLSDDETNHLTIVNYIGRTYTYDASYDIIKTEALHLIYERTNENISS